MRALRVTKYWLRPVLTTVGALTAFLTLALLVRAVLASGGNSRLAATQEFVLWSVLVAASAVTFAFLFAPRSIWRPAKFCEDLRIPHAVFVGMAKAVYVRDEDVDLWERAEAFAKARRMPVSGLVMAALEAYLADADGAG